MTQELINQRFGDVAKELKKQKRIRSFTMLAEQLGVSQSFGNAMINGTRGVAIDIVNRLVEIYPDVNQRWLLGQVDGPMFLAGDVKSRGQAIVQDYVQVPLVRAHLRASFVESYLNHTTFIETELVQVLRDPKTKYEKTISFEVDGDSMEPIYQRGAIVLAEPVAKADFKYISSGVYLVVYGNEFTIKRVKENEIVSKGYLTLHADNPNGGKHQVLAEDLRAMWRVKRIIDSPAP